MNEDLQIKEIDRKIMTVGILDMPGTALLGLGLYAKFAANGDAFHPLLNDPSIVNGMLALGAVISVWAVYQVINLTRKKAALLNKQTL